MEYIGQYLKQVRVESGFNLKDIAQELKISKFTLEDIENNNFPEHLNSVFLIGHIRAYSKFLNLDCNKIIKKFKIELSYRHPIISNQISKPIKEKNYFPYFKTLSFTSIIVISLSFYFLFIKPNDMHPRYAITPDLPENFNYHLEETEMKIALLSIAKNKQITNDYIRKNSTYIDIFENEENISRTSASASFSNESDFNHISKIITLKFVDSTWIQLRDDKDSIIQSKLMNKGDEYKYNLSENLFLTAGNAGNIIVLINGVVKGKAGKSGEVIDSLIIDNNFDN
jgi:cytoskeletal protein RodZ